MEPQNPVEQATDFFQKFIGMMPDGVQGWMELLIVTAVMIGSSYVIRSIFKRRFGEAYETNVKAKAAAEAASGMTLRGVDYIRALDLIQALIELFTQEEEALRIENEEEREKQLREVKMKRTAVLIYFEHQPSTDFPQPSKALSLSQFNSVIRRASIAYEYVRQANKRKVSISYMIYSRRVPSAEDLV